MNILPRLFLGLSLSALSLNSLPVFADSGRACRLGDSYGFLYNGTNHTRSGPVTMTQTGTFSIDNRGNLNGEGTLAFQFSNFADGKGPLWLLLREVQSRGVVITDTKNPCTGIVEFVANMTVIKTSDSSRVTVGTVLIANAPRSMAYTISGRKNERIDLISTSPGTIASGVAHKQN